MKTEAFQDLQSPQLHRGILHSDFDVQNTIFENSLLLAGHPVWTKNSVVFNFVYSLVEN